MLKKLCVMLLLVGFGTTIYCMEQQKESVDPNDPGDFVSRILQQTALHKAAFDGSLADVQKLLKNPRVNVNARDAGGDTPLDLAANNNHADIVHELLQDPRVDVNARNIENGTPLHTAALRGSLAALKELLRAPGIDVNAKNLYGRTALELAKINRQFKSVQIIQQYIDDKAAMAAFLHATHERLGQDSPAQDLPDWVNQQIYQELMEKELPQ